MRLVTWNCNFSLSKKLDKLVELKPDVAVVQECEQELDGLPDGVAVRRGTLNVHAPSLMGAYSGPRLNY
jgi:hypothetical protein